MRFHNHSARFFVPDGMEPQPAVARTTHLGIGAHQDDLEFMALHGILACYGRADRWFGGVTCTNGAGSARSGVYAACSDEEMMAIRRREQETAAVIGRYGFVAQLDYPSAAVKDPGDTRLARDLEMLLELARPEVVYTHNPADKHETHVAVTVAALAAIRALPDHARPRRLLGCEVWRGLDWMDDREKVVLDVSDHEHLTAALHGVFDSQIAGGKRYDLAVAGRQRANATFLESHQTDAVDRAWLAMDLTPLIDNPGLELQGFVEAHLRAFAEDVRSRLSRRMGR